jgi:hypothetical protein
MEQYKYVSIDDDSRNKNGRVQYNSARGLKRHSCEMVHGYVKEKRMIWILTQLPKPDVGPLTKGVQQWL